MVLVLLIIAFLLLFVAAVLAYAGHPRSTVLAYAGLAFWVLAAIFGAHPL